MNTKMIFADYPDIPSCLEPNPICMHSCPDIGHFCQKCAKKKLTSLTFATYWYFTKRDIEHYPPEWRDEEVVICQQDNVCVLVGSEARQKRRAKMLTRQEIINRLKFLRQDAEEWGPSSLLDLKVSFAGMMYDMGQGLGLSKQEYTRILGKKTLQEVIDKSNKVYVVNPKLLKSEQGG